MLEPVFLRGDFGGLLADFAGPLGYGLFQCLRLRLESLRVAPGFFALVQDQPAARAEGGEQGQQPVQRVPKVGAVPGRQNGKAITRLLADLPLQVPRSYAEAIIAWAQAAVVGLVLLVPIPPILFRAFQKILVYRLALVSKYRGGK